MVKEELEGLIAGFLARDNSLTGRGYGDALNDFATYRRKPRDAALADLLRAGATKANELATRYARSMTGTRDTRGHLNSGRGLSPSTVNLRLTVLRSIVKKARKAGMIQWELDVPSVRIEDAKDNRGPGIAVARAMLKEAKLLPSPERERAYAIIRLFSEVGPRRKEIIGLDIDDFDASDCSISILAKGRTQKRVVPISDECVEAIQAWLKVRPAPREGRPLFTNLIPGRCSRISGSAVYLMIRGIADPIANPKGTTPRKFKRVSPHKLRHVAFTTAAGNAQKLGLSREAVQKFTGHRDARSVSRYIDAADDVAKKLTNENARSLS